jgi:myo-inositol-1(or 4)-monophosphatase
MIEELRKIGKRLYSEIAPYRYAFLRENQYSQKPPRGASGDRTFPVDKKAEEIILEGLEGLNEPLSIVSEEYGLKEIKGGGKKVLIDPIDGSKNAITGIPFYCSSIAIAEGNTIGSVTTAYVINLLTGDEFYAEKGRGAFMNGHQLKTQKEAEIYLVAYEAQTPKKDIPVILHLLGSARRTRCLGATALDLALLAQGSISIFVSPAPSRSFDFAAGWLLVKEAGGVFTDIEGKPVDNTALGLEKTTTLLASGNEELHKKALKLLRGGKQ